MLTVPNLLSFCRIPLAFVFLQSNPSVRALVVLISLLSDGLDGFIARKTNRTTRLGTLLDPLTDRFFVIFALSVLYFEHKIALWEVAALFCRDGAIVLFGFYLLTRQNLSNYYLRAIWCGKITTFFQLVTIFALTLNMYPPVWVFYGFIALGFMALVELGFSDYKVAES